MVLQFYSLKFYFLQRWTATVHLVKVVQAETLIQQLKAKTERPPAHTLAFSKYPQKIGTIYQDLIMIDCRYYKILLSLMLGGLIRLYEYNA